MSGIRAALITDHAVSRVHTPNTPKRR